MQVADFPVYHIFRASTPLAVHNVCEDVEWEGMHMRLRMYKRFLEQEAVHRVDELGRRPLYIVSDGLDVFFNDMHALLEEDDELHHLPKPAGTALLIVRRYEEILGTSGKQVIFSTERLCGWGGAHLCSDEDEARYPEAPTDSKYLNAGGYIGPAAVLERIISDVLEMAQTAKTNAELGDLRAKTTAENSAGGETDQYFFKVYFWTHPEVVAMDYYQGIFGNFLEVKRQPCENGWRPQCAFQPCCTESDEFRRFHEVFYGKYEVRECAVWRQGKLPVSWHGNGLGKWIWLISLNELSSSCNYFARLVLSNYPVTMLDGIFERFERIQTRRWHDRR